jgi:Undecaprenyl-phosphate glucose phosphotransferase
MDGEFAKAGGESEAWPFPGTASAEVPRGGSARRAALLGIDLGFRLSDAAMLLLAVWATGVTAATGAGVGALPRGLLPVGIALVVTNIVFSAHGIYRDGHLLLRGLRLGRLAMSWWQAFSIWLTILLSISAAAMLIDAAPAWTAFSFQPVPLVLFFVYGLLLIAAGRLAMIRVCALAGVHVRVRQRTCILGSGPAGQRVAEHFALAPDNATDVLGYFDEDAASASLDGMGGLPFLGGIPALLSLIARGQVDTVLVVVPWSAHERIDAIVRCLAVLPVSVGLVPEPAPFRFPQRTVGSAAGLPRMQVCERPFSDWACLVKRLEDMILTPILLLAAAPVMAAVALAVKLESPGPVLFSQRRYGLGNRVITVHKFRTMHAHLSDPDGARQTICGDHRLTRVGALLRRFSLDELPQLFNVMTGDMSLVGPRPHALSTRADGQLFEDAVATYMARHRVKPGITGWAQVNGWRGETDTREKIASRVEHDLYYIGNWSLAFDLLILLRTASIVSKGHNAY